MYLFLKKFLLPVLKLACIWTDKTHEMKHPGTLNSCIQQLKYQWLATKTQNKIVKQNQLKGGRLIYFTWSGIDLTWSMVSKTSKADVVSLAFGTASCLYWFNKLKKFLLDITERRRKEPRSSIMKGLSSAV